MGGKNMKPTQVIIYTIVFSMIVVGWGIYTGGMMSRWSVTNYQTYDNLNYMETAVSKADAVEESVTSQDLEVPQEDSSFAVITGAWESLKLLLGSFDMFAAITTDLFATTNIVPEFFIAGIRGIVFTLMIAAIIYAVVKREV
jgi:hypothetical protein